MPGGGASGALLSPASSFMIYNISGYLPGVWGIAHRIGGRLVGLFKPVQRCHVVAALMVGAGKLQAEAPPVLSARYLLGVHVLGMAACLD